MRYSYIFSFLQISLCVINANIKTIGDQAFEKSKKLKNVTIGKDVNKIGKKAFANCSKLNKVIIKGKALKNKGIGKQAFSKTA
ncbi:MAG: leucine-rich repeat protein, partial [Eubacterium sp.]|nr:leucine-rich repeat protein [Eubacterium sp.]